MPSSLAQLGLSSMCGSENVSVETSATAKPRQLDVDDEFLLLLERSK